MTMMTTLQERWAADGFYIHDEPVLEPDVLARAALALTDVRNGVYATGVEPVARWKPGDNPGALAKIEMPQLASRDLVDALCASRLGEVAGAITGAEWVQVWWVQGLYKPPTTGSTTATNIGWHQDMPYWADAYAPGSQLFTAWLALSNVHLESGPMQFVRGSHRWGALNGDFFNQDQDANLSRLRVPEGEAWSEVSDVLPAGGVSFHDRWLLHGSHQNVSSSPRISMAIHLRTEASTPVRDHTYNTYLDNPDVCPVIFRR